eukprot:SAG31_NODE_1566_length_7856_cov_8.045607_3_plen_69_part_00
MLLEAWDVLLVVPLQTQMGAVTSVLELETDLRGVGYRVSRYNVEMVYTRSGREREKIILTITDYWQQY